MADSMALPEGPNYTQEIVWRPEKLLDCDFAAQRAKSFRAYERHNARDMGGVFSRMQKPRHDAGPRNEASRS
jgi:hypothetical protein